ncbi:MAG: helix-turn-helix domain-containing protein, partial [Pseudomonadales bacterium]|nr:helix-turn-helix domain-containing protein [Pseudomonadales bacterium]
AAEPPVPVPTDFPVPMGVPLRVLERQIIEATIAHCGGSIPRAAGMLEVSPSTIYRKKESWERQDAEA